ncbi:MAG: M3 family oligoendopeptidase [Spirochaetia bacterium]|nr:M3 family oligoendopeptidase [Spirochaetia bacterium]
MSHAAATLPEWNLKIIYPTTDRRESDKNQLLSEVDGFASTYRGRVASLSDSELVGAFSAHAKISNLMSRLSVHAYLTFAGDTSDSASQALVAATEELSAGVWGKLVFFELEIGRIPKRAFAGELAQYSYFIEKCIQRNEHNLTEDLESYGIEKNLTGVQALTGLFDEVMGGLSFETEDAEGKTVRLTQETALAYMHHSDRKARTRIYSQFLETVGSQKTVLSNIYNNVVLDHRLDTRRRKYNSPMEPRNLNNQVSSAAVNAMLGAVESRYGIVRDYYSWKARYAAISDFTNADIYAPVLPRAREFSFDEARQAVLSAYGNFDSGSGKIVDAFFTGERLDARLRTGKRPGAFCYGASPELDAFVHLNFTGDLRSVQTLAHELGHGLHHQLAKSQNHVNFGTPLVTAETASVFGEILLNELLFVDSKSREDKLALVCAQMESVLATVFRQTVLTRFEEAAHAEREKGRVSADKLCELWLSENSKLYGNAVRMVDAYKWGWAYIPHFVHTPFYCYAYSFGQLMVLALYEEYMKRGEEFKRDYLRLLSLGGSLPPAQLIRETVGLDIEREDFWLQALAFIDRMMKRIESLA